MPFIPAEDLAGAARLALAASPRHCHRGPHPAACDWYHPFYPLLRLLGLAATPERHRDFYLEAFQNLAARGGSGRVLITGAADACMLAHLLEGSRAGGGEAEVTVLDRCGTPLELNAAYGRAATAAVATRVSDILDFQPEGAFDLLTTHAFIGMLPHGRQAELLTRWRGLLRPGGRAVTVARVDPDWREADAGFSPAQAEAFADLVASRAEHPDLRGLGLDAEALRCRATAYAARMASHPFRSREALETAFAQAGFRFERLDCREAPARAGAHESGPGIHRPGTFAHLVAVAR
jgi:SAM-dependent methyltransferase